MQSELCPCHSVTISQNHYNYQEIYVMPMTKRK